MECFSTTVTFLDSKDDGRIWRAEYVDQEIVRKRQQATRLDRAHIVKIQKAVERVTMGQDNFIWTIVIIFINPALF